MRDRSSDQIPQIPEQEGVEEEEEEEENLLKGNFQFHSFTPLNETVTGVMESAKSNRKHQNRMTVIPLRCDIFRQRQRV